MTYLATPPDRLDGAYYMRRGEALVPMTSDMLRRIFDEAGPDFSAEVCDQATLTDLDVGAIEAFRTRLRRPSRAEARVREPVPQTLADAELTVDGGITYAALILFGTRRALGRHPAQAEVVFEYRSSEASGPASQREEFREGFFLFHDRLWTLVNLRNDEQSFQDGFFMPGVPTFNEVAVREAVANAVIHRHYRLQNSVFVRQYARRLEAVSPGGLPSGVTVENILWAQAPRNRRLAEALGRCDVVERSGQGVNRMFEESIKEAKAWPRFDGTSADQVFVTLLGQVQNPAFLRFLARVGPERIERFGTKDLLVLDLLARDERLPPDLVPYAEALEELGVVERVGRGRGQRFLLSRALYAFMGRKGTYTRKRGLDQGQNKELLLKHIRDNAADGSPLAELQQVVPALSRGQLQYLLEVLRGEGLVHVRGLAKGALWYPGAGVAPRGAEGDA